MSNEYPIKYTSDVGQAVAGIDQLISKLNQLDSLVDRIAPKIRNVAKGADAPMNTAAKSAQSLASRFQGVADNAATAHEAMQKTGTAAGELQGQFGKAAGGARSLSGAIRGVGAAGLTLAAVRAANEALTAALKDARDYARETAEENIKLRDSLRELKAIKGDKTITETAAGTLELMTKGGGTSDEAKAFETMWGSAIPAARESGHWKLNDKETKDAKVESFKFAVANGIDMATMARMVTATGTTEDVNTADDVLGKLSQVHRMAIKGVGTFTPLMQAASSIRGNMLPLGGAVNNGALMGQISAITPLTRSETTAASNIERVFTAFSTPKDAKHAEEFGRLGLKPGQQTFPEILRVMKPHIEKETAAGRNPLDWLRSKGFKNKTANRDLVKDVSVSDVVTEFDAEGAKAQPGSGVRAQNQEYHDQNPARFAAAQEAASRDKRGEASKGLETLQRFTTAKMVNQGTLNEFGPNLREQIRDMNIPGIGSVSQGLLMQDPARLKTLNEDIINRMVKTFPVTSSHFPELQAAGRGAGPDNKRLSEIFNAFPPAQQIRLNQDAERDAQLALGPNAPANAVELPAARAAAVPAQAAQPKVLPAVRQAGQAAAQPGGVGMGGGGPRQAPGAVAAVAAAAGAGGKDHGQKLDKIADELKKLVAIAAAGNRPVIGPMMPGANPIVPGRK